MRRLRRMRLGAKLALAYGLTTAVSLLLIEILGLGGVFLAVNTHLGAFVAYGLRQDAVQVAPYFADGAPRSAALQQWMDAPSWYAGGSTAEGYLAATDRQGQVVASVGGQPLGGGTDLLALMPPPVAGRIRALLAGTSTAPASYRVPGGPLFVAVPVPAPDGGAAGVLVEAVTDTWGANLFWAAFYGKYVVGPTVGLLLIFGLVGGTLFGLLTTRTYVRRLADLAVIVGGWSRGDFARFAQDRDPDELGALSRELNRMAGQLHVLMDERGRLAALQERHRIARDLHDSVRQQLFAASMQISAGAALVAQRGGGVPAPLADAAGSVARAQAELSAVIEQLHPAELGGRGLAAALRDYVGEWSRRSGIAAEANLEDLPLPGRVEEALLRIAQEGMANIMRHSGAASAHLALRRAGGDVVLSVADDGRGFDAAAAEGRGLGLRSMRERAEALGGRIEVTARPGGGACVSVAVPA